MIEVDGEDHKQIADEDRARDEALAAMGFRVIRVWNSDVTRDFDSVMSTILAALEK